MSEKANYWHMYDQSKQHPFADVVQVHPHASCVVELIYKKGTIKLCYSKVHGRMVGAEIDVFYKHTRVYRHRVC